MKARWLVVGLLAAGGTAAAAIWALASPEAPAPRDDRSAVRVREERSAAAAPLGAVAIVLADSKPRTSPARQPGPKDEMGCGPSGEPCADDELCVDGGCLGTTCAGDGGACALGDGRVGSCCEARCVDLASDAANCGRCGGSCESGLECTAGACLAGSCAGRMAGTPCSGAAGGRCCRGACVDAASFGEDTSNCGACGHACAPGLSCRQGACTDPATDAPPGWTCVEPAHACPEGTFCAVDACLPQRCSPDGDGLLCPSPTPGVPGHCCGGRCVDLFSDGEDCGACGRRCGPGQQCQGGICEASAP